jgi:hypothetical protein
MVRCREICSLQVVSFIHLFFYGFWISDIIRKDFPALKS